MVFSPTAIDQPLPMQLLRLAEQYDLTKSPYIGKPGNFAVTNMKPMVVDDRKMVIGELFDSETLHSNVLLGARGKQFIDSLLGMTVRILVDEKNMLRMFRANQVYLHQILIQDTNPLTLQVMEQTLILPIDPEAKESMHTHTWHIEQFCGGYGGWKHGLRFLQKLGLSGLRTLSIDIAKECVVQYGLTHEAQILLDLSSCTR